MNNRNLTNIAFCLLVAAGLSGCGKRAGSYMDWQSPQAKALQDRIAVNPKDAQAYYWRGYAASHIDDVPTVRASYRKAIELDPENRWYRISYGWALFNAGAYQEAKDRWQEAYEFCKGEHPENEITMALGCYGVKEYEKAAAFYDRQVGKDRRYANLESLQEVTSHWTWREKEAIYDLFDIWRYSYR